MKTKFRFKAALALAGLAGAMAVQGAPVAPNANSLLKGKRVLIVKATNWAGGGHADAANNALAKLELIKTTVGIASFTVVDNVENMQLPTMNNYDIIVFNYVFNSQMADGKPFGTAFKAWLAQGNKAWMGYHTSGANDNNEWNWYRDSVTSMRYHVHSTAAQEGKMNITSDPVIKAHPILAGMAASFTGTDEWYDFDLPPRAPAAPTWNDCKVIYYLDEVTLANKPSRPMNPHPMAWFREDAKKNRFFYSGFIHSKEGASSDFFHSMLLRGLEYVAGYEDPSITIDGAPLERIGNLTAATPGRTLKVQMDGAYELSLWSASGGKVYSARGTGPSEYAPEALKSPGVYFVKLESKLRSIKQRIVVY